MLIIALSSLVTGVFAWFTDTGRSAEIDDFGSSVISDQLTLEIETDVEEIYLGDRLRDLVYVMHTDYVKEGFDFYGYASILPIVIKNPHETTVQATVSLNVQNAPEFGNLAGRQEAIKYLVVENPQPNNLAQLMFGFQQTSNVFTAMQAYNQTGYTIAPDDSKQVYVFIWGYYEGLTTAQKDLYHALIYRVKVSVEGGA